MSVLCEKEVLFSYVSIQGAKGGDFLERVGDILALSQSFLLYVGGSCECFLSLHSWCVSDLFAEGVLE